jgi:apolipoprotein N-acyltransferase
MKTAQFFYSQLKGQKGWRRWALAFLLGVLGAGAMAPVHAVFLLVPAMMGLIWLTFAKSCLRGAFAAGWWFGLGHFAAGFYWVANALFVHPDRFGWMAPFAVFALAGLMAVFTATSVVASRAFGRHSSGVGRVLVFAAMWVFFEWMRSWMFTGFPWNLIGSIWTFSDAMIQSVALAGVYGLGLLSIIVAGMPAILAGKDGWRANGNPFRPISVAALALVVVWAGGAFRLSEASNEIVPGVVLRLVQPNIDQKLKWKPGHRQKNFKEQIRMSGAAQGPGLPVPTHVFWAETAATYSIDKDLASRKAIARSTPKGGLTITGAPRTVRRGDDIYRVWNSMHGIDEAGNVVGTYDKFHLVPFGEYTPLRKIFKFPKITAGATDFSAGPGPRTLRLKGLPPVSPLICYEVIFPSQVVDRQDRPEWLLNLTNDGWYGASSGPYQHFDAARLRAVEEGLPLVRVANTGISGVIDGYGRVVSRLALGTKGTLDSVLPRSLKPTPYGRLGNWLVIFLIFIIAGAGILTAKALEHKKYGKTGLNNMV